MTSIAPPPTADQRPGSFGIAILLGLQNKPVYAGTADPAKVAKSRARNKSARAARRHGRRS